MAPLTARMASAVRQARRARIKVTAVEGVLRTRYTSDTIRALMQRYPGHRFVWLMGSDNLAQFHRWRDWRGIARRIPIAVIARPGYDRQAIGSPAMAWLRRYRVPPGSFRTRPWRTPALIMLHFDPDPRSATQIRRADPDWFDALGGRPVRDQVTHRLVHAGGNP